MLKLALILMVIGLLLGALFPAYFIGFFMLLSFGAGLAFFFWLKRRKLWSKNP